MLNEDVIKDVIVKCKRNYDLEKKTIYKMSTIMGNIISKEEICDRLEKNGFNGLYIVPAELFSLIVKNEDTDGFYSTKEKVILINEDSYIRMPSICVHEMCHAYFDDQIIKRVMLNESTMCYGRGIEEGIASVIQSINSHDYIDKARPSAYIFQSRFFQQLNELYKYTDIQEYSDLLIHVLKKPSEFLPLIKNIYYDILENNVDRFEKNIPYVSAQRIVTVADLYTENDNVSRTLYDLINCMNSLYLTVVDPSIYTGAAANNLFNVPDVYKCDSAEYILYSLMGQQDFLRNMQISNLDYLHGSIIEEMYLAESKGEQAKVKCFKR